MKRRDLIVGGTAATAAYFAGSFTNNWGQTPIDFKHRIITPNAYSESQGQTAIK